MTRRRLVLSIAGGLACAAALLYFTSSTWRADRFRERIQVALQNSLHRPVKIGGKVQYSLFGGPGFAVDEVTIGDAPEFGTEPLAYVTRLEGRLGLMSLLSRDWQFSSLRLIEPSLNLAQDDHGSWNIQPLIEQRRSTVIPIEVRDARINFRGDGRKKSPFYLTNARADVSVSDGDQRVVAWSFEAQPARTDKGEQGFGQFSGSGKWQNGQLTLDVQLERSAISELVTLTQGQSYGVQGFLASRMHFSGPPHALAVNGQMQLEDVNRWASFLPQSANARFPFRGTIDLPGQNIDLRTTQPGAAALPLAFQLKGKEIWRQPRWATIFTLHELPLSSVMPVARRLGQNMPEALQMQGVLTGVVSYSSGTGLQGEVEASKVSLQISRSEPFSAEKAQVLLNGSNIQVQPVELANKAGRTIQLSAEYRTALPALAISMKGESLPIADLQTALDSLGVRSVPILRQCNGGFWSGTAEYLLASAPLGKWIGDGVLKGASITLPGSSEPVQVRRAAVTIDGDRVVVSGLDAKLGALDLQGEYRYEPDAPRPHLLKMFVPTADAAEIERLFVPANRKPRGFFARTLRFGDEPIPTRIVPLIDGTIRIGRLRFGAEEFEDAQSRLVFEHAKLEFPNVSAKYHGSPIAGAFTADVTGDNPVYHVHARAQKWRWRNGLWDIEGDWDTTGAGPDLLTNLHAAGTFQGKGGDLAPDLPPIRAASGAFEYQQRKGEPALRLKDLQLTVGRDVYHGEGTADWPGRIDAQLESDSSHLHLAGTTSPWRVRNVPADTAVRH